MVINCWLIIIRGLVIILGFPVIYVIKDIQLHIRLHVGFVTFAIPHGVACEIRMERNIMLNLYAWNVFLKETFWNDLTMWKLSIGKRNKSKVVDKDENIPEIGWKSARIPSKQSL